jgi:hypothetical protein
LLVRDRWKLSDLGSVTERGQQMPIRQRDADWPEGLEKGDTADPADDLYTLDAVLRRASEGA